RDNKNPTEAIFLSPNFTPGNPASNQLEVGTWTVSVTGANVPSGSQQYALVVVGAVSRGSWDDLRVIRKVAGDDTIVTGSIACNDKAQVVIDEFEDIADPTSAHTPTIIRGRTVVQVVDPGADRIYGTGDDVIVDTETPASFTNVGKVWTSNQMTVS